MPVLSTMGNMLGNLKRAPKHDTNNSELKSDNDQKLATPFIIKRWSSMYIDEDGDVAHEFYEESKVKNSRRRGRTLKRITENLKPKGWIGYDIARINNDLPFVMFEVRAIPGDLIAQQIPSSSSCR